MNNQLIVTSHDSRLLESKLLRRDEIWFSEMSIDKTDKKTQLFSLISFDDDKEKHIDIAYLEGRYGAIPELTAFFEGDDSDAN